MDSEKCDANFKKVLQKFCDLQHLAEQECDGICKEFATFLLCDMKMDIDAFKNFSIIDEPLDTFFCTRMQDKKQYSRLFSVIQKVLILSHGQATVERGFSIYGQIIFEHLKESSVEKQRIVYDAISEVGGLTDIEISKTLLRILVERGSNIDRN